MRLAATLVVCLAVLLFLGVMVKVVIPTFVAVTDPSFRALVNTPSNHSFALGGPVMISGGLLLLLVFGVALVLGFMVSLFRRQPIPRSARGQLETDEARMMQEIHRSLTRMDERIEALETLLLEREPRGSRSRLFEGSSSEGR